jgi:hypothetical protein
MNYSSARQCLVHGLCATALLLSLLSNGADCAVIRNFDSVPAGDIIMGGAVLSGPGAPGNPASQMNNTAAPAWGNQAANYTGQYIVDNANLVSELGTSSLSAFTVAYAYKPDIPNDPDVSARQLAFRQPPPGGLEVLGIGLSAHRQDVEINSVSVGLPGFTPGARLMDGDPLTTNDGGGTCCSNESEWVYFAMTYEILIPGVTARVKMYGMSQSEAAAGLQEIRNTTGFFGDAVDVSNSRAAILGNTGFGGGTVNRPADSSFDALRIEARVVPFDELAGFARAAILPIPEPSSFAIGAISLLAVVTTWRRSRKP